MDKLPPEIQNRVYQFLNPISKPTKENHDGQFIDWCSVCGEYLGRNDICIRLLDNSKHRHMCFNCFNSRRYQ